MGARCSTSPKAPAKRARELLKLSTYLFHFHNAIKHVLAKHYPEAAVIRFALRLLDAPPTEADVAAQLLAALRRLLDAFDEPGLLEQPPSDASALGLRIFAIGK